MSEFISGKEALIALANGEDVELQHEYGSIGLDNYSISIFKNPEAKFRLKPRTITLNGIEVPAPFEPKDGDIVWVVSDYRNGYREFQYSKSVYNAFGTWRTEEEIKQVVAALRSVFGKK